MTSSSEYVVLLLIVFIVVREIFYQYTVNKMINKIMSRNYQDYAFKPVEDKPQKVEHIEVYDSTNQYLSDIV